MTAILLACIVATVAATSFLSGIFGMAGGLILIGVLLLLLPLPVAMVLHAVTQMASNGWRAFLWRKHVCWRPVCAYLVGAAIALLGWSLVRYVPDKAIALIMLGATPFVVLLVPARLRPNPDSLVQGVSYGLICMTLMVLTGVAGPLIDRFFLGGQLGRREIVASKSMCQVAGHTMKLFYFGGIVEQAATIDPLVAAMAIAASVVGTTLAKRFLEGMSDANYRLWTGRIITAVSCWFLLHGFYLLMSPQS